MQKNNHFFAFLGTKNGTSGGQIKNLKTLSWIVHLLCIFLRLALLDNLVISKFPVLLHTVGGLWWYSPLGRGRGHSICFFVRALVGQLMYNVMLLCLRCVVCAFSQDHSVHLLEPAHFQVGSFPRTNPMHVA